ncbi:MAG: nickel-dependent lactate racemase [Pyrinomonadaceae bacterium]
MKSDFGYGNSKYSLEIDSDKFISLGKMDEYFPLTDLELGEALEHPINSPKLEEIISPDETVLIVVHDATRVSGSAHIINLLVRRLISSGVRAYNIAIIFATGLHRKTTRKEKELLVTSFVAQRMKMLDHVADDLASFIRVGRTSEGIAVELNKAIVEYDRVITVGSVNFHYFAGFSGGRKLICPGLASKRTIAATHELAFDCKTKTRATRVESGILDGNPVNEAFMEATSFAPPDFAVNTFANKFGEVTHIFCGDWRESYQIACNEYARKYSLEIHEKREFVIASCGGEPFDINLVQAHKALENAAAACVPGGTIILFAKCADGLGSSNFLEWFESRDSAHLADRICEYYSVNGQTAWTFLKKVETFNVKLITELPEEIVTKLRCEKIEPKDILRNVHNKTGYAYHFASRFKAKMGDETPTFY